MEKRIEHAYRREQQDIYNVMDLLREELDRDKVEDKHLPQIDHIKRGMVELYRSTAGMPSGDIYEKLEMYRQTQTYPSISDDLDMLLEKINFCSIESKLAEESGDKAISADRRYTGQYLADVFNLANKGQYAEAYEHFKSLPLLDSDHVPQRLQKFLRQYK